MRFLVGICLLLVALLPVSRAQLNTREKQLALDVHNDLRGEEATRQGVTNMREMQWDEGLADAAQDHASECYFVREQTGQNLYIKSAESLTMLEVIEQWYSEGDGAGGCRDGVDSCDNYTRIVSAVTYRLGCDSALCPSLALPGGGRMTNVTLVVCNYAPAISIPVYSSTADCPTGSQQLGTEQLGARGTLCVVSDVPPTVPPGGITTVAPGVTRRVTRMFPRWGSLTGGTRLTISGTGFSNNQFAGGNQVLFSNGQNTVPCHVIPYSSNNGQIICDTSPSIGALQDTYFLQIMVDDGEGPEPVDTSCNQCRFRYHRNFFTPTVESIDPLAAPVGSDVLVNLFGLFRRAALQEDLTNSGQDYITRIDIGGMFCDFIDENGNAFNADLDGNRGTIGCKPNTGRIDSMNTTVILANRGNSYIPIDNEILSLDNKLRPYSFQTHADILGVSPNVGSTEGGTGITVSLNTAVEEYTDIRVYVGGVPCEDVTVYPARPTEIQCTTGPQPPPSTYYPGGRGLLREVWLQPFYNLDDLERQPRSELTAILEKAYRDSSYPRQFGELFFFSQRYSGFFVPPVSCLYTFAIHSDDGFRLYLSPNTSVEHKERIAESRFWTRNRWNFFEDQISDPIYLESGRPYYLEAMNFQGAGPWDLGIGAKLHCLDRTTYPFIGDREVQLINISSTVVREQHQILLGGYPVVYRVTITSQQSTTTTSDVPPTPEEVCITLDSDTISFFPNAADPLTSIETSINELENIQRIGYVRVLEERPSYYDYYRHEGEEESHTFSIIFQTRLGVSEDEIPLLSVYPCDNGSMFVTEVKQTQNLTIFHAFNIGFNSSGPLRFTSFLPVNVSAETLQTELMNLLGTECEKDELPSGVRYDYESEDTDVLSGGRDNGVAFCGHYSLRNPTTMWEASAGDESFFASENSHICFASLGSLPPLRVSSTFINLNNQARNSTQLSLTQCPGWPTASSGWHYTRPCINVFSCLEQFAPSVPGTHTITEIAFDSTESGFWIDDFTISNFDVEVTQTALPAQTGGVTIDSFEISRELFDIPMLIDIFNNSDSQRHNFTDSGGSGSGSGSDSDSDSDSSDSSRSDSRSEEPQYAMIVSTFTVTYNVLECRSGIPILQGYYYQSESGQEGVEVRQIARGSPPVEGTFELSFGNRTVRNIQADTGPSEFERLMEANFPQEQGFIVTRSGGCEGYKWRVEWETRGGDVPPITVSGEGLIGSEPQVTVETLLDGGVWIRPFRADMLRLPETEPQVEVIINDIPSSCNGRNCSFSFSNTTTPQISFFYPYEGQGGTEITIYGRGFTDVVEDITVTIGESYCVVSFANETVIVCTAEPHTAGYYDLQMHIDGSGFAQVNESFCFHYLLTVDSIERDSGGVGGGEKVVISGNGFLEFVLTEPEDLGEEFPSDLPWFRYGLGEPSFTGFDSFCSQAEVLLELFSFESSESFNITRVIDELHDYESERRANMSRQFNRTFENMTDFGDGDGDGDEDDSEGDFDVELFWLFLHLLYARSPSSVFLGEVPCIILSANTTQIECVTAIQLPGRVNVSVRMLSEQVILEDAFEYTVNDTVFIEYASPGEGPVYGSTEVEISGRNFVSDYYSSEDDAISVQIGDGDCQIQFVNATYIVCLTQPNPPGRYSILVSTPNGIAVWESALNNELLKRRLGLDQESEPDIPIIQDLPPFPLFYYQLHVFTIGPLRGSKQGGTIVSAYGVGFREEDTEVYIGDRQAVVVFVNGSVVNFATPDSSRVHQLYFLDDLGYDSTGLDFQFAWDQDVLEIETGDTVEWNWDIVLPGYTVNVFQTPNNFSSIPTGFASPRSAQGTFSYTFSEPGVYYYASEISQTNIVRGEIHVRELQSSQAGIRIVVSGYEADFVFDSSPEEPGSGEMAPVAAVGGGSDNKRSATEPMFDPSLSPSEAICLYLGQTQSDPDSNPEPFQDPDFNSLSFEYDVCFTPIVLEIFPRSGNVEANFTIRGVGFSPYPSDNTVKFGDHYCTVISSSLTELQCRLDLSSSPPAFTELYLSVNVEELGDAYISFPSESSVYLRPVIQSVYPEAGSVVGGTEVRISGQAFPDGDLHVMIGSYPCEVQEYSYTAVYCITTAAMQAAELNVTVYVNESDLSADCVAMGGCTFAYSEDQTAIVTDVSPTMLRGPGSITLTINGTGFSATPDENIVFVGETRCQVLESSSCFIECELTPPPAGSYPLSVQICLQSSDSSDGVRCLGYARIDVGDLVSAGEIISITPNTGSILGGTLVAIEGVGFMSGTPDLSLSVSLVEIGCRPQVINYTTILCETDATAGEETGEVRITLGGILFDNPETVVYSYNESNTPAVTGISPTSGQQGETVTITGSRFSATSDENTVVIGGSPCVIDTANSNENSLQCTLGANFVGTHNVNVSVAGRGRARSETTFFYTLQLDDFQPREGSQAGRNIMRVTGVGFDPNSVSITICDQPCVLTVSAPSLTAVECTIPHVTSTDNETLNCTVTVESLDQSGSFTDAYVYRRSLTPIVSSINRTRGGTAGGSRILLEGSGLDGNTIVTIADIECAIIEQDSDSIICETDASGRVIRAPVRVCIDGNFALADGIYFFYIDLWSSNFTWGGGPLPLEDDFVVIPAGQTILLDTVTPRLAYLLIQGGELIFDDEKEDDEVQLHTQGVLITEGGRLQVGTEDQPFMHKTRIVLYGHVLSTEIPVYGAKTLAVRKGELDLHGRPLDVTWTRLSQTANPGDTELRLQDAVDWEVGGKIVIASTSFSQRENEELTITNIDSTGTILTVDPPLEYEHISIQQVIEGRHIDTRAEVGYLTRNVVVRGNLREEWVEVAESCRDAAGNEVEFRTGQFEVQTCFLGRFGEETINDQFGSQIMIHAAEQNQGDVVGRISYIEVTHAGQAFRLGRYPIHFHLNGDVTGSYVRGCGIHHTFNRAVTIHAVDNLLIEKNVAYNILGHAYFTEDGIEQNNIIQDNLGIFVRASSSLLNVDITPATFWIVNPNNIVRRNAAAGGTHFGFWYRLPLHPTGPSATTSVCPRHLPVGEFANNTAHSFGWYGLWVFPEYHPRVGGGCNDQIHTPVVFETFTAWRNDKGVEFAEAGSLQLRDNIMLDNVLAGVEVTELDAVWGEEGPLISNTLIVGHSELSANDPSICTESGIKTPRSYYLTVSGVTFVNFNRSNCYVIQACSDCEDFQGGFETRFENIRHVNSPQTTKWQWEHEHVQRDLDGTLTEQGQPSLLVPTTGILPSNCQDHPASNDGDVPGSICEGSVEFGRAAIFDPSPDSLEFSNLLVSNPYGVVTLQFVEKRLIGGPGYMAILPVNETYTLDWPEGRTFTNISYSSTFSAFTPNNYIVIAKQFPRPLDSISVEGNEVGVNESVILDPIGSNANTGDWYFDADSNNTISYVVRGESESAPDIEDITFSTFTCFYPDCTPPPPPTLAPPRPPGRPELTVSWSSESIWPDGQLPQAGENVFINCSLYVLVDIALPRLATLRICGELEFEDTMDHELEVDLIIIEGGRLIIGYPETPFTHQARIILHGNTSSPEHSFAQGPTLGAKAIGVFGQLILHGMPEVTSWTTLLVTASQMSNRITVLDATGWQAGDQIVITSTSYEALQSEVFTIQSISGPIASETASEFEIELDGTLMHSHIVEFQTIGSQSYSIRAEVGRLTRNVVIENGEPDFADQEAFGCRILVGSYREGPLFFVGSAQIQGVEFKGCGQLGYTETFDPRFALAFLNIGSQSHTSYVRDSSFHDGFNTAIGVFSTNELTVDNNMVHITVGTSIYVTGSDHIVTNNLASLSLFIGTYRSRNEPTNSLWTANFELTNTVNLTLMGNAAAGGAKAGFHTNGEECTDDANQIRNNVAHSTLHCIHMGYEDGHSSGCSKLGGFLVYSCFHYGIFSYGRASVWVTEAVVVNNKAGIYVNVIGPPALSHVRGNKEVRIENSLIVSASQGFDCTQDSIVPEISMHELSNRGLQSPTRGHVGVVIPSFVSGPGHFPPFAWSTIITYPAISGLTTISNVLFSNFDERCSPAQDVVLMTNAVSEDCNHPVRFQNVAFDSVPSEFKFKVFNHEPNLGSVNPSDCVDMDCDGLKHVLLVDRDGSFTETGAPRSIISMAEFEWDMDPRRGIGDYRIPRTMLSNPDGSRIDANELYPGKGIVRGFQFGERSHCQEFEPTSNTYMCSDLEHLMLVIESLDADTEVRRLSPIGLGTNGFIDLLNGPQDNGWCGGYTCQERISTFYGIVASGFEYTIGLTSTNPQDMALHLLHADRTQSIVTGIIYTNPQRLDVYYVDESSGTDIYVVPKNAELQADNNLRYFPRDPANPNEYLPRLDDPPGTNYYDRDLKRLYITINGSRPYVKIITKPVIQVSLDLAVSVEDFFDPDRLVQNLAFLLGIPQDRIRVVNVVRETVTRKRQTDSEEGSENVQVDFEIGDPPVLTITTVEMNDTADMNITDSTPTEGQNTSVPLTFEMLEDLTTRVVEVIQTGELEVNGTVVSTTIEEPEPERDDPTGGVRATPDTGGPQPEDIPENSTIALFFETVQMEEEAEQNESTPILISIPTQLVVLRQPASGIEGLPLSQQPMVAMYDNNGEIVQNLGVGMPWVLTASIETGPDGALITEDFVNFTDGRASFTNLTLSHPGSYSLTFTVTYPPSADFSVISEQFTVTERQLQLAISVQPEDGNTTRLLFPYPVVRINNLETGEDLTDPDWRNREWYVTASIEGVDDTWRAPLVDGEALFTEIAVSQPGTYQIQFSASTEPSSPSNQLPSPVNSDQFTIEQLPLTRLISTYDADFDEVVGNDTASFTYSFVAQIQPRYQNIEIFDVNATRGSINISFFATASTSSELTSFISQVTFDNSALSFTFNGSQLTPVSIEQDSEFSVTETTTMPAPMTTEATTVSPTTTMPTPMTTEATTVSPTTTMPAPMTTEATTVSPTTTMTTPMTTEATTVSPTTTMPTQMTTEATTVSPTTTMPAPMTTEATTVSPTTTMPTQMTTEATTVSPTTTMPAPMTTEATTVSPTTTMTTPMMPVTLPTQMTATQDNVRLILGTVLPGSIILLIAILIIVAAMLIQRHHKKIKTLKITVPREGEIEGRYAHIVQNLEVSGYDDKSMDEFRLVPDHRVGVMETELSEPYEESAKVVVSTFMFTNPAAKATDTGISNLDLQERGVLYTSNLLYSPPSS